MPCSYDMPHLCDDGKKTTHYSIFTNLVFSMPYLETDIQYEVLDGGITSVFAKIQKVNNLIQPANSLDIKYCFTTSNDTIQSLHLMHMRVHQSVTEQTILIHKPLMLIRPAEVSRGKKEMSAMFTFKLLG